MSDVYPEFYRRKRKKKQMLEIEKSAERDIMPVKGKVARRES